MRLSSRTNSPHEFALRIVDKLLEDPDREDLSIETIMGYRRHPYSVDPETCISWSWFLGDTARVSAADKLAGLCIERDDPVAFERLRDIVAEFVGTHGDYTVERESSAA